MDLTQLDSKEEFSEDELLLGDETLTEKKKREKEFQDNTLNELEDSECPKLKEDNIK